MPSHFPLVNIYIHERLIFTRIRLVSYICLNIIELLFIKFLIYSLLILKKSEINQSRLMHPDRIVSKLSFDQKKSQYEHYHYDEEMLS